MHLTGRFRLTAGVRAAWLGALMMATASSAAAQTTKTLTVAKDSTIRGGSYASTRYGSNTILVTRRSSDDTYERRAVLTFDTETTVPDNAPIQSAKLVLTVRGGNSETRQLEAHSIPVSFDEPYVTWRQRKSSTSWRYAGGEVTGSPATSTVTATVGSQVTFDVTAHVQNVINGKYGSRYARFLVADAGSSSRDSYREYHSGEASTSSYRPRLVVTYGGSTSGSTSTSTTTSGSDVVLAPGASASVAGKWVKASDSSAAGGVVVRHPNASAAKLSAALASPANYFEMTFTAEAGKPYRLWLHGRAESDYWGNDSVFVQFSGSVTKSGSATYRIGTTSATEVNLEECSGCGLSGWQWQDNGWGKGVLGPVIYFASTGTQRIRVQTREDGLSIDRIVLSPSTYLNSAPPATGSSSSTSSSTSPSTSTTPSEPSSTASTLKVLDWNIHHGVGTDGKYSLQRFVTWIAKWRPDVISLNEVEKYTSWGNEDQPKRFRDLLQSATGQTWYVHFAQRYNGGTGNGQGNAILSRYPFASTAGETLSYDRSLAIATIVVNGRNVAVMSTHLDADSNTRRETQVKQIMNLATSWSEPRIVAGDFNAWPDHLSIAIMGGGYYDGWAEAVAAGTASSFSGNSPFGATKRGRIDYIWRSKGSTVLKVKSAQVPDTRDSSGVMPSDHRPVLVTYEIR